MAGQLGANTWHAQLRGARLPGPHVHHAARSRHGGAAALAPAGGCGGPAAPRLCCAARCGCWTLRPGPCRSHGGRRAGARWPGGGPAALGSRVPRGCAAGHRRRGQSHGGLQCRGGSGAAAAGRRLCTGGDAAGRGGAAPPAGGGGGAAALPSRGAAAQRPQPGAPQPSGRRTAHPSQCTAAAAGGLRAGTACRQHGRQPSGAAAAAGWRPAAVAAAAGAGGGAAGMSTLWPALPVCQRRLAGSTGRSNRAPAAR